MEKRKNLCAMIPEELHGRVKQEQEALALNLAQYVEMVLEEHFKKGGKEMGNGTRTLAFQVSEELFGRVKEYLAKHPGLSQREFVIGLITKELERYEAEAAGENRTEAEGAERNTAEAKEATVLCPNVCRKGPALSRSWPGCWRGSMNRRFPRRRGGR